MNYNTKKICKGENRKPNIKCKNCLCNFDRKTFDSLNSFLHNFCVHWNIKMQVRTMIIDQNISMCVRIYNEYRSEYKYVCTLNIDQNTSMCVHWI